MVRLRWYGWAVLVLLSLWLLSLRRPEGGVLVVPTPSPAAPAADRLAMPWTPTPPARDLAVADLRLHPDGLRFEGDRLSAEVVIRNVGQVPSGEARVVLQREAPAGEETLAEAVVPSLPPGGAHRVVWTWVWTAPAPGVVTITVAVRWPADAVAANDRITGSVRLLPRALLPEEERRARWAEAASRCCRHVYLTGTAAERDLPQLMAWADAAEAAVRARMGLAQPLPTTIVWIPRLLGQGGFAFGETVVLSYPLSDRLPADVPTILQHELVHRMTCALVGRDDCLAHLPSLVVEGLAVALAGGHYRPEPLPARAAALRSLGRWIPLDRLVEDFYAHPHEAAYLEAGAFTQYLIQQGGWPRFRRFLQALERRPGETDGSVLDRALRAVYHQSIQTMEARWVEALAAAPADPREAADLRLVMAFYDALRAYQRAYDPSAYFAEAWLPDWRQAAREGIVADFMRAPESAEGRRIWEVLQEARQRAARGDVEGALERLAAVCAVLDCGAAAPVRGPAPGGALRGAFEAVGDR